MAAARAGDDVGTGDGEAGGDALAAIGEDHCHRIGGEFACLRRLQVSVKRALDRAAHHIGADREVVAVGEGGESVADARGIAGAEWSDPKEWPLSRLAQEIAHQQLDGRGDRPNGAGKTILMRVISGLIRPMRGSMRMEGIDLVATPSHRIVELGIPHGPPPVPAHDGGGQPPHGRVDPPGNRPR